VGVDPQSPLEHVHLIAIGTGTAYCYSLVAAYLPHYIPRLFRTSGGEITVYFEAAAVITTLVLLGQVLELHARSRTSSAIRALSVLPENGARAPGEREETFPLSA
jgi:Cu+-exporting ATPase